MIPEFSLARLAVVSAVVVTLTWICAVFIPPILVGLLPPPPEYGMYPLVFLMFAFMGYSGIRARQQGMRSRYILRVVVPLSILLVSLLGSLVLKYLLLISY